jgi:hypothetical protein
MSSDRPPDLEGELVDAEDLPLGETIWIAKKLEVSFDGRLDQEQTVPLATGIVVDPFVSGVVVFIVHDKSAWADSRVTLSVRLRACSLDPMDPDLVFPGPALVELGASGSDAAPRCLVASLTPGMSVMPGALQAELVWSQLVAEAKSPQTASISVGLVLRRKVVPGVEVLPEAMR